MSLVGGSRNVMVPDRDAGQISGIFLNARCAGSTNLSWLIAPSCLYRSEWGRIVAVRSRHGSDCCRRDRALKRRRHWISMLLVQRSEEEFAWADGLDVGIGTDELNLSFHQLSCCISSESSVTWTSLGTSVVMEPPRVGRWDWIDRELRDLI